MSNNSPEASFRLVNVTATIWYNESTNGSGDGNRKFRTVQLEQRYKDGDEWKSSSPGIGL